MLSKAIKGPSLALRSLSVRNSGANISRRSASFFPASSSSSSGYGSSRGWARAAIGAGAAAVAVSLGEAVNNFLAHMKGLRVQSKYRRDLVR